MWAFISVLKRDARNSVPFAHHTLSCPFSSPNLSQREAEHGVIFRGQRDRQSQGPNHPGPMMGKSRSQLQPRGLNAKDKANARLLLINFIFFFNHSLHSRILIIRQEEMSLRTRVLSEWKLWLTENRESAPWGPRQGGRTGKVGTCHLEQWPPAAPCVYTMSPVTATLLPRPQTSSIAISFPGPFQFQTLLFIHVCCRNYILLTPSFSF